jgi:hypothetical protein
MIQQISLLKIKEIDIAMLINISDAILDWGMVILPKTRGLRRFIGCFLSLSKSMMSLIRYTPLAAKEKSMNVTEVFINAEMSSSLFPNNNGRKIKKFFVH